MVMLLKMIKLRILHGGYFDKRCLRYRDSYGRMHQTTEGYIVVDSIRDFCDVALLGGSAPPPSALKRLGLWAQLLQ